MRRLTPSGSRPTSMPSDDRGAAGRFQQAAQHADGGRLARAVAPRKPKISPGRTSNERWSTATKLPKRRVRSATVIGFTILTFQPRDDTRFGDAAARERLRAIELGLQQGDLRVEDVGAGRHAGEEPLVGHAARLGGGANPLVGRVDGGNRRAQFGDGAPHVDVQHRVELVDARAHAPGSRLRFRPPRPGSGRHRTAAS